MEEAESRYWEALSNCIEAERTFHNDAPKTIHDEWGEKWIEAAKMRTIYLERLEEAQILWQMASSKA